MCLTFPHLVFVVLRSWVSGIWVLNFGSWKKLSKSWVFGEGRICLSLVLTCQFIWQSVCFVLSIYKKETKNYIFCFINGTQKSPKLVLWYFHFVERMWNIISKLGGQAPKNNKNRDRDFWKKQKNMDCGRFAPNIIF